MKGQVPTATSATQGPLMRQVETAAPEQWDGSTWPREAVVPPSLGINLAFTQTS